MKIKRPMTLIASILSTVFLSIAFVLEVVALGVLIDAFNQAGVVIPATYIVIVVLDFIVITISLVFNIFNIPCWNYTAEKFRKSAKLYITTICLTFFVALLDIISLSISGVSVWGIFNLIAMLASGTLYIIDISLENKRIKKYSTDEVPADESHMEKEQETKETKLVTPKTDLEEKLEKLSKMLENNLINENEYSELKKKYIQDELNK